MVIFDSLEDLGVSVGRLDERSPLALEDTLGSLDRRVNQGGDLESGSKLVLESERVAKVSATRDERKVKGG